jgi:hypothetical protein
MPRLAEFHRQHRPYRYSPQHKIEIEKQVRTVDCRSHKTQYKSICFPSIVGAKESGTWRFCVDYRKLNAITVKNKFPMPIIDEILDDVDGVFWYTKHVHYTLVWI